MPVCPRCGFSTGKLFKCDKCGDVRCNGGTTRGDGSAGACGSSHAPGGRPQPAGNNKTCYVCKKGKYHQI